MPGSGGGTACEPGPGPAVVGAPAVRPVVGPLVVEGKEGPYPLEPLPPPPPPPPPGVTPTPAGTAPAPAPVPAAEPGPPPLAGSADTRPPPLGTLSMWPRECSAPVRVPTRGMTTGREPPTAAGTPPPPPTTPPEPTRGRPREPATPRTNGPGVGPRTGEDRAGGGAALPAELEGPCPASVTPATAADVAMDTPPGPGVSKTLPGVAVPPLDGGWHEGRSPVLPTVRGSDPASDSGDDSESTDDRRGPRTPERVNPTPWPPPAVDNPPPPTPAPAPAPPPRPLPWLLALLPVEIALHASGGVPLAPLPRLLALEAGCI